MAQDLENIALILPPLSITHPVPSSHPERPERLEVVRKVFSDFDAEKKHHLQSNAADISWLTFAHESEYVNALIDMRPAKGEMYSIDGDTNVGHGSIEAALHGVGGALEAVDLVMNQEESGYRKAFSAARPPGHHAERHRAMGFCLFNTAAIAAYYAREQYGLKNICVFDFDVHHGNGTQDIFWNEADFTYISTHETPLFPGTGQANEKGAYDQILNVPLKAGDGDEDYLRILENKILPFLEQRAPELVIFSAGFDAHSRDPLANINLSKNGFYALTKNVISNVANTTKGRFVSVLEGGYDLVGLEEGVQAHLEALSGL